MALHFLYRKSSGQVHGVSTTGDFGTVDTTYFGVVQDPLIPDGADLVPTKIFSAGIVRNALEVEIAGFQAAVDNDNNLIQRQQAGEMLSGTRATSKFVRALLLALLDEINLLRESVLHPITSITRSGTTATVTAAVAHNLATGDSVVIVGADLAAYNGQKTITVTGANTFTYGAVSGNPATPATGSIFYALAPIPPTPTRTVAQARTVVINKIQSGAAD
ncbi:MAG TPA: hypothetical protein VNL14_16750 [Candidatus Acidoferrales bacterium]|nr:hypothetical protein [Candidatus Acidoferrales bacterium]